MAIRPTVAVGTPGVGIGGGIGVPFVPIRDPGKKFTSQECLQAVMDAINDDNSIITNQVTLLSGDQRDDMRNTYWPAIFDHTAWVRISTTRPTKDEDGEPLSGTDREVRLFENDTWADASKSLEATVTTEFGEIIDIKVVAKF